MSVQECNKRGEKMKLFTRFKILLAMVGVVLIFMGGQDLYYGSKTPANYNDMLEADFQKGMIVEGDLYANYGAFEENYTTTNGVKTGSSQYNYMIPVGEEQYMGLLNDTSSLEALLDEQMEATYAYIWGESASEPKPVHFKGRVMAMDSETRGYLKSYMIDIGFTTAEADQLILPYYIKCENYSGGPVTVAIGLVMLIIAGIIVFAPLLLAAKQPKNDVQATGVGGTVIEDDFGAVELEEKEDNTYKSAFDEIDMTSTTSTDGLGTGVAEQYESSTGTSTTGLKLKE